MSSPAVLTASSSSGTAGTLTSSTSPTPPPSKPKPKPDALYILDANTATSVLSGVTQHSFSTWAMDLRAQVTGGTVSTYSWSLTNAPDATNVSGSGTYRLQFSWASFTGAVRTDTIVLTTTNTDQSHQSQTITFKVNATDSPAYTATAPTSVSTWPTVVTPDEMDHQATVGMTKYYKLGLATGELFTQHMLPAYTPHPQACACTQGALELDDNILAASNPDGAPLHLVYSSLAADARPMFIDRFQIDPSQAAPPTIKATLTFNGTQYASVWYSTSALNPGDIMEIPLQADAHTLSTGRYSWSISVTANYVNPVTTTQSGSANIINENGSLFGAGWTLVGVDRLWAVTGGVILEESAGRSLWFASNGQGGFITPAGDFSTLVQNQDSTYTRTLKDGTKYNFSSAGRLTSVVDRNGNSTSFGYDGQNRLSTITDFNSLVTNLAYNAAGRVSTITDPASRVTTLGYNGSNDLTSITDPDTAVMTYGYDTASGRMTSITDPRGNVYTPQYNNANRVSTVTRPTAGGTESLTAYQMAGFPASGQGNQGNPASPTLAVAATASYTDPRSNIWKSYHDWLGFGEAVQAVDPLSDTNLDYVDANGLPWLMSDPLARRTRTFFDSKANPTKTVLPDDAYSQATFNSFSEPLTLTDPLGNVTSLQYDTNGNLTQRTDPDGGGPLTSPITTMTYTTKGFLSTVTDPLNHTTTLGHDTRSRVTSVTDPLSHVTGYDTASNVTSMTDARNNTWSFTFDNMGRTLTETLPGTPTATYTLAYDLAGDRTSVTDPLSHATTSSFNNMNWMSGQTDSLNHTWNPGYDLAGNLTSVTDPLGHAVTYAYDAANRRTSMTDALNHATSYGYDVASQLTTVTDALSHSTTYGYSVRGFVTSITDALSNQTQFGYDLDGNRTSVTDPLNHTTSYAFDHLNRLLTVTDARNGQTQYAYDAASRLTSLIDPVSNVTGYAYDNANNVTVVTDPNNHTTQYGYDNDYNVTSIIDRNGRQRQFTFDVRNRETAEKWLDSQNNVIRTISFGYDNSNRLTSASDSDSNYTYGYDNANRLTSVDNNGTPGIAHVVLTYGYDNANRLTSLSDNLATSGTITYGYDNANRLTSLAMSVGGTSLPNVSLGYDNANRETSITRTIGGTGNSISSTIGYDNANRLTSITHSSSVAGTLSTLTYSYDAASRVTSFTGPEGTLNYGYDNTNQLTSVTGARSESYGYDLNGNRNTTGYSTTTGNRLTSDGTYNYTYDNEGNVLTKTRISDSEKWTFTWDYRNRLTDVVEKTSGGSTVTTDHFTYDVFDHRIGKSVNGTTTWTLYAGDTPYADFNSSGSVLERYLADPNAIDNFFARYDGTTTAWYLQDMLGSVREIVKTDGTVLDQLTYDSYGNIVSETNANNGDRFKFAGMQWDSEIGQYYAWHREYLAGAGRFESEDPKRFRGGDSNLYRYVLNNPVSRMDPSGFQLSLANPTAIQIMIAMGIIGSVIMTAVTMEMMLGDPVLGPKVREMIRWTRDQLAKMKEAPEPAPLEAPVLFKFRPVVPVAVETEVPPVEDPRRPKKGGPCEFYLAWCKWGVKFVPEENPNWTHTIGECERCYETCKADGGQWNSWPFEECPIGGTDPTRQPQRPGKKGPPRWPRPDEPWPWKPIPPD